MKKVIILEKKQFFFQEPELYTNSLFMSFLIKNIIKNNKQLSEKIFYNLIKHYKLNYKLLIYKQIFEHIEKNKPAILGKPAAKKT